MAGKTISQRITLEGTDELKRELTELAAASRLRQLQGPGCSAVARRCTENRIARLRTGD
jgi:hypothetical protein